MYITKRNTQVFCNDLFKYFMFYVLPSPLYLFASIIKQVCESAETPRDSSNGQSFEN